MQIARLNLASQPFRNRTLPWLVTVVVASISIVALFFIISESRRARAQAEVVERDIQLLTQERSRLQTQAAEIRQSIPQEQLRTLEAAHLLVDRKRFSWSKLLSDLEAALPTDVRVTRISVRDAARRGGQTRADLELAVVGRAATDVTRMITEMNRSGVFTAFPLTENQKAGRGESGYEWTLEVSYVQRAVMRDEEPSSGGAERVAATSASAMTEKGAGQ